MIFDEGALRGLIEDVVRRVVRDELAATGAVGAHEFVNVAEAARRIDVAPATIREWIGQGRLRRYHAGRELRVRVSELQALISVDKGAPDPTPEEAARRFLARKDAEKARLP